MYWKKGPYSQDRWARADLAGVSDAMADALV
jgi:hypothetical protein